MRYTNLEITAVQDFLTANPGLSQREAAQQLYTQSLTDGHTLRYRSRQSIYGLIRRLQKNAQLQAA